VNFFSGFCLEGEELLFENFIKKGDYCVAGFSKGAIDAFSYVLDTRRRVDTLLLFSPAFFQNKDETFKRAQLHYFRKDEKRYIENFLKNCSYGSDIDLSPFFKKEDEKELKRLLNFTWRESELERLKKSGVLIEVFLGGRDKIIDSAVARDFFKPYASVYFIKEGGHLLNG